MVLVKTASASTFDFTFSGSGVSGAVQITYGTTHDTATPSAIEVTGITGTITDTNNGLGIVNASITGLVPLNRTTPEATNLLAPNDFSQFAVASGLPATSDGAISYDNLFYQTSSPQTASDYPLHGGFLDIYGLLFTINNGDTVNFWSNGTITGVGPYPYGIAVVTSANALDYTGGVTITPEPSAFGLAACALTGFALLRRRRSC